MKRAVIFLIILASACAAGNAQYFVEGRLCVRYNYPSRWHNFYLNVSPLAGYQLNDKMAVGAKASLIRQKEKSMMVDQATGDEVQLEWRRPGWSLAVFGRKKISGTKKISFLVETSLFVSGDSFIEMKETVLNRKTVDSSFGINMLPLVTYELFDRLSLIATCEFFSLDLSSQTSTDQHTGLVVKRNHFGLTGKSSILGNIPLNTRVGVVYYFKIKQNEKSF